MSLALLVAIAEIAGSIAVVATVAFLALQVRENTRASRMTGQQMINDGWLQVAQMVATDPDTARIYREGMKDLPALSTDDQWRFGAIMQIAFASSQNAFLFGDNASLEGLEAVRAQWLIARPGPRSWWPRAKRLYHPDFRDYVDGLMAQVDVPAEGGGETE